MSSTPTSAERFGQSAVDDRLAEILTLHFDSRWGAPYWIDSRSALGFDPLRDIRDIRDLDRFPPFPLNVLSERPIEYFIPRRYHDELHRFIVTETGGTTGPAKRTAFLDDEFEDAFVRPFAAAAEILQFPRKVHWLFVGPSGPHIIGKAARACATAMGSLDPFMVDFDPRWSRTLAPQSLARERYLRHVIDQALSVLGTQDIGVLFATPPVVEALVNELSDARRESITGLHLGGIRASKAFWERVSSDWFPNAVVLSGYGNSLAGMCPQLVLENDYRPHYYPHGSRLVFAFDDNSVQAVRLHRLDRSCFLPNVVERDHARRSDRPPEFERFGFVMPGLTDPGPSADSAESRTSGLY